MNDIGSNSIGSIAANLDSDSQQTMFERPNHYESTSLPRDDNRRYSLGREDEKSIEKDIFEPYSTNPALSHQFEKLTQNDKRFLLAVERGDLPAVKRLIRDALGKPNINCCDPLGRSGLLMAIDNENLEMIELLISSGVEMKDALLHAINEEFVEAVELLLDQEQSIHTPGTPHSWESTECQTFTNDLTPLMLAAHRNNYEIIKILIDQNFPPVPNPHDARCGCKECCSERKGDCLRHSRSRINAYKALCSPSLIALSSKDPILTAFDLSWRLRRLSVLEPEFKSEYLELRKQCQTFATTLLDHTRTSKELEILLNYDPVGDPLVNYERMQLARLTLAIKVKQKMFVAHANVQQLLASIWYEGLPGFRRRNVVYQTLQLLLIGLLFPILSIAYILAPSSRLGKFIKKPFIKFICHSASYVTFLFLLMLASQRIETDIFGTNSAANVGSSPSKRGSLPSYIELIVLSWVFGLIWSEIKQLWNLGINEYMSDYWNVLDFLNNSLYVATITLRVIAYYQTQKEIQNGSTMYNQCRELWHDFDPILLSEGLFATANIFSSLKLVYMFSVNPYLGPLQISLGRMVIDILKFFSIYLLVLFSFACGMNQLLWYYADLERGFCVASTSDTLPVSTCPKQTISEALHPDACFKWRRFANLFESIQTLFWATFGLIDLDVFELAGIKGYTRFWALHLFGVYCVINVAVLMNLLIAMMNHSYQRISEQADKEWKFARSKLWMSYFSDGETVPPPFNIFPSPKAFGYAISWLFRFCFGQTKKAKSEAMKTIRRKQQQANERDFNYLNIMHSLIRRYIMNEQRIQERQRGVTEDDCNEIKQDISALRFEMREMLREGQGEPFKGDNDSTLALNGSHFGRKSRTRERRLLKGFNFDLQVLKPLTSFDDGEFDNDSASTSGKNKSPSTSTRSKFSRIAQGIANKRNRGAKWRALIEATRNKVMPFSRSQDSMDSDALGGDGTDTNSNQNIDDSAPSKLNADYRRQIYAMKLESVSLSQPALPSGAVSAAMASNAAVATQVGKKYPMKQLSTIATTASSSEIVPRPVETKVIENNSSKSSLPCDIIAMKKDDWI